MKECVICKEPVLIPVEFICFGCYRPNAINCSSYIRTCRKCAHDYLELDQSILQRTPRKRCLFCPASVSLFELDSKTAYRKDFLLLGDDPKPNHICPYCHHFSGNQIAIDNHMDSDCPASFVHCACGSVMKREDQSFHLLFCSEHQQCVQCHMYVLADELDHHMLHVHQKERCRWCRLFFLSLEVSTHESVECIQRLMTCSLCHSSVPFQQMRPHLEEHAQCFEQRFRQLTQDITSILHEYRRFVRFRNQYRVMILQNSENQRFSEDPEIR